NWIDELWERAKTPKQKACVQRLFALGFTKLCILHSLEFHTIEHLLNEGVPIPANNFYKEHIAQLEELTVNQLLQYLQEKKTSLVSVRSTPVCILPSVVRIEVKTILYLL